jgi:hypothetical protein
MPWRTSCPRLPVWEQADDCGFVARHGMLVSVPDANRAHLRTHATAALLPVRANAAGRRVYVLTMAASGGNAGGRFWTKLWTPSAKSGFENDSSISTFACSSASPSGVVSAS